MAPPLLCTAVRDEEKKDTASTAESAQFLTGALVDIKLLFPSTQTPVLQTLTTHLSFAFDAEKALGHSINKDQDPTSASRLWVQVCSLLKHYANNNVGDWKGYAHFSDVSYVRNLVVANDTFELMVVCWRGGQFSNVHNHGSSHCWLAVLDGEVQEVQYQPADAEDANNGSTDSSMKLELRPTSTACLQVGDVGYINDNLCLHRVGCTCRPASPSEGILGRSRKQDCCKDAAAAALSAPAGGAAGGSGDGVTASDAGAVTLHLYAPPIRRVKIYDEGRVTERLPGFFSIGGVRT